MAKKGGEGVIGDILFALNGFIGGFKVEEI